MFLRRVILTDFRGHHHLDVDFTTDGTAVRKQTVLLGENGTGKSNLLKAIALLTAGSDAIGDLIGGNVDEWIRVGADTCTVTGTLVTQARKERSISLTLNRGDTSSTILLRNQDGLNEIDAALAHAKRNYFVLAYGASRRLNRGATFIQGSESLYRNNRAQNVATLFNPDALLSPLSSWAMELDYRQGDQGIKIIRDSINDFLPGLIFDSIDRQRGYLMFRVGTDTIPLHLLSDGYQNITAWIGDLLYRVTQTFEDYQSPLKARGLLLIDEIDLHLHPKWQRMLLDYIRRKLPNLQIIATTHSPLTAQQAGEGELVALMRNRKNIIEAQTFVGNPQQLLVHQLLMSPLFGLETDESLSVEKKKTDLEMLKKRKYLSTSDQEKKRRLSTEVGQLPANTRSNAQIDVRHLDLLDKINAELTATSSDD